MVQQNNSSGLIRPLVSPLVNASVAHQIVTDKKQLLVEPLIDLSMIPLIVLMIWVS